MLIVKDVRIAGNKLAKPERSVTHYETLFRNNGVDQKLITFMPLSQLLNDYAGYEERRKLAFLYEQFIVDQDIAAKVNAFLGTKMLHDGRGAFPVDLSDPAALAETVDEALRSVYCMYTQPTDDQESKSITRVGRHSMANENIVENIIDLLSQLQDLHPGRDLQAPSSSVNFNNFSFLSKVAVTTLADWSSVRALTSASRSKFTRMKVQV